MNILPKPLRGVVPPIITPLADKYNLDLPGLKKLIEHVLAGGVHGLFLLGDYWRRFPGLFLQMMGIRLKPDVKHVSISESAISV